jgi:hypothetical protein
MRRADRHPACICPRLPEAPAKAGLEALPAKGRSAVHSAAHIRLQFEISMSATPDLKISSSARLAASRFVKPRQGIGRLCVGRLTNKTTRRSGSSCVCIAFLRAEAALLAGLVGFIKTVAGAQLLRPPCGASTNTTGVPFLVLLPNNTTSQFVSRTQPWDSDLLTLEGSDVPWMP